MTEREAAGIDLPDRPGLWFREGEAWVVRGRNGIERFVSRMSDRGYLEDVTPITDLPRGNWQPAVPASALAERDAEIERLKARIAWLERPGAVRIGEQA